MSTTVIRLDKTVYRNSINTSMGYFIQSFCHLGRLIWLDWLCWPVSIQRPRLSCFQTSQTLDMRKWRSVLNCNAAQKKSQKTQFSNHEKRDAMENCPIIEIISKVAPVSESSLNWMEANKCSSLHIRQFWTGPLGVASFTLLHWLAGSIYDFPVLITDFNLSDVLIFWLMAL